MRSRRNARESALQALYQCDALEDWSDESIALFFQSFTREAIADASEGSQENIDFCKALVKGVREHCLFVDNFITRASTHWNLERMARVDRNILRLAAYEIGFVKDIPVNVSINEAIEIAKRFGADDSRMFVNGVLDRLAVLFRESEQEIEEYLQKSGSSVTEDAVANG